MSNVVLSFRHRRDQYLFPYQARLTLFNDISHYKHRQECEPHEPRASKAWDFKA